MKSGNWVPIDKNFVHALPIDGRPYTELEAMFSLSVDYDNGRKISISGLAKAWGWNRKKVVAFFAQIGVEIVGLSQGKRTGGTIIPMGQVRDKLGTSEGHFKFNNFNELQDGKDKSGTSQGQVRDNTIYPDPEPDPKKPKNKKKSKKEKFDFRQAVIDKGVDPQLVDAWMEVRKTKRAANTEHTFNGISKQVEKSGRTWPEVVNRCAGGDGGNAWSGFNAKWEWNQPANNGRQRIAKCFRR